MALRINASVKIREWSPQAAQVFEAGTRASRKFGHDVYLTSVNDGRSHSNTSFHYDDLGWDLGVAGNVRSKLVPLHRYVRRWLPPAFQELLEAKHVHVEWDAN